METNFYTKSGLLTRYGYSCGYVDRIEKNGKWKEMYSEHTHFHVRSGNIGEKFQLWEVFSNDELTKARNLYKSIKL